MTERLFPAQTEKESSFNTGCSPNVLHNERTCIPVWYWSAVEETVRVMSKLRQQIVCAWFG